jgi:hypothetical protein
MYEFAVVALLGLATLKVADVLVESVPALAKLRTLLTFVLAVTVALALDHSMFAGFGIPVREAWMGTVGTGLVIGSLASAWAVVLGWLGDTPIARTTAGSGERPRIAA